MFNKESPDSVMPDLVVNKCLFGCDNGDCPGVWINYQVGHRIVCKCTCSNHSSICQRQMK